jgi:hypothetical protein
MRPASVQADPAEAASPSSSSACVLPYLGRARETEQLGSRAQAARVRTCVTGSMMRLAHTRTCYYQEELRVRTPSVATTGL